MLKAHLVSASNFNLSQAVKVNRCIDLIIRAVNTDEFKQRILNFSYDHISTTGFWRWAKTTKTHVDGFDFEEGEPTFTNQEIYDIIMKGRELHYNDLDDETMDLELVCRYTFWHSATAYGLPGDDTIYLYSWWVDQSSLPVLSNTIIHEWLHKIRFEHSFNATADRPYSIPYGVGQIVEDIIRSHPEWIT